MKLWHLYYWNKHEYCWKWLGMAEGETKQAAIQWAKQALLSHVNRGDMMKVEEYNDSDMHERNKYAVN